MVRFHRAESWALPGARASMERLTLRQREFYVRVSIFIRGFLGEFSPLRVFTAALLSRREQTKRCTLCLVKPVGCVVRGLSLGSARN